MAKHVMGFLRKARPTKKLRTGEVFERLTGVFEAFGWDCCPLGFWAVDCQFWFWAVGCSLDSFAVMFFLAMVQHLVEEKNNSSHPRNSE